MKKTFSLLVILLLSLTTFSQAYKKDLSFSGTGDLEMPLGRIMIGTTLRVEIFINGGWAQDGGVYHIASDWGQIPKVIYRGESQISHRLKFHAYVDPASNSYAFLFATWVNESPDKTHTNVVSITMSSNAAINTNNTGEFSKATELKNILVVQSGTQNVGIGTTTPDAKLTVAGKVHAQEVKVTVNAGADFVFADNYKLPDLTELEKFVSEKKHLPGIQSEKAMQEEGLDLGQMNIRLLQKVEELTLYVIAQNKAEQTQKLIQAEQQKMLEEQKALLLQQQQEIETLKKLLEKQ